MADKISIPDRIIQLGDFLKTPHTADEISKELKDTKGFKIGADQIKMALLRLLRQEKVKRRKEGAAYKYYIT